MSILIKLISDYALWLYLILAVIGAILLRMMNLALKERSRSIFALERENATARFSRAMVYLVIVLLLAGGVYYTANILIEQVPLPKITPTPTQVVQLPPTPTSPKLLPTPTPTLTPTPRPTAAPVVVDTPTPEETPNTGAPPNCPIPGVQITQPGDGATVSGTIQISGSANIDNFDYYKFEFLAPGGNWNFIERYNTPVSGGLLATWNTATVPPGQYGFRLIVVDKIGNYPTPCEIKLNVQ